MTENAAQLRLLVDPVPPWRAVPGYEDRYEVSDRGEVRALRFTNGSVDKPLMTPRLLKPWPMPRDRYLFVTLCRDGKPRHFGVHILVLLAFVGPRPLKYAAAHLDGDRTNNRLANLVWATYRENERHKKSHGRAPVGSRNPFARLTEADVREIRALRASGVGATHIADCYEIERCHVYAIAGGRAWRHVL